MSIIDNVETKLKEYGIEIYNNYAIENDEHVFYADEMIEFVNKKDNAIGVSFQASTRPEKAANLSLILNELGINLDIMESFIFDQNNSFISGEKAFKLLEDSKKSTTIQSFIKNQAYKELLLNSECFEC